MSLPGSGSGWARADGPRVPWVGWGLRHSGASGSTPSEAGRQNMDWLSWGLHLLDDTEEFERGCSCKRQDCKRPREAARGEQGARAAPKGQQVGA